LALGVHAHPTRGAKFNLSSSTSRPPSSPLRDTLMLGAKRIAESS
jgi:hypothetical protein